MKYLKGSCPHCGRYIHFSIGQIGNVTTEQERTMKCPHCHCDLVFDFHVSTSKKVTATVEVTESSTKKQDEHPTFPANYYY